MKSLIKHVLVFLFIPFFHFKRKKEKIFGLIHLSKIIKKGINCRFEGDGIIYHYNNLKLGNDIFIGRNFFIKCSGQVSIGDYTHISRNVVIHTSNHNINGDLLPYDRNDIVKEVKIGKFVWIGMNVNILPGVEIGDGAVIGMGTVITKDVAPGDIVVGGGQRVVGKRCSIQTSKLKEGNKYLKIGV